MRGVLLSLAVAALVVCAAPSPASAALVPHGRVLSTSAAYDFQQPQPPKDVNVDINVNNRGGGYYWYRSPVWIAIGAIAFVVIVLVIMVAARGGGSETTIVKD